MYLFIMSSVLYTEHWDASNSSHCLFWTIEVSQDSTGKMYVTASQNGDEDEIYRSLSRLRMAGVEVYKRI